MRVITETTERTIETPTAVMAGLAAPSQGTAELSTWRVRMTPGSNSPVHIIDREQVWMPLHGTFEFTVEPLRDDAGKLRRSALRAERMPDPTPGAVD